jgi:hypothetical protein
MGGTLRLNWKRTPRSGDMRTIFKFAWIPKEILGEWIWLERYKVHQAFYAQWGCSPEWHISRISAERISSAKKKAQAGKDR